MIHFGRTKCYLYLLASSESLQGPMKPTSKERMHSLVVLKVGVTVPNTIFTFLRCPSLWKAFLLVAIATTFGF